jgi:hypothetical protein
MGASSPLVRWTLRMKPLLLDKVTSCVEDPGGVVARTRLISARRRFDNDIILVGGEISVYT